MLACAIATVNPPLSRRFSADPPSTPTTMANEMRPTCEVAAEAAKTDHQVYKIHNQDDFGRITRGIKVARCMQSPSSYGEPPVQSRECSSPSLPRLGILTRVNEPRVRLFLPRRADPLRFSNGDVEIGCIKVQLERTDYDV